MEGKLGSKYLGATQSVLRSIADITEQLNVSFSLQGNEGLEAISRISASLHLLQHQVSSKAWRSSFEVVTQQSLVHNNDHQTSAIHFSTVTSWIVRGQLDESLTLTECQRFATNLCRIRAAKS